MRIATVRLPWVLLLFVMLSQPAVAAAQTSRVRPNDNPERRQRMTGDLLGFELVPSFNGQYKGASFQTNRWGMRDREYEIKAPPGTYRVALLGSSFTLGGGVPLEKTLDGLLEDRLNREGPGAPGRHYEILNFSVGNYGILQNVVVLDRKVFPFAPNAVLVAIHDVEQNRMINHVASLVRGNVAIEIPYLRQKLQDAGVKPGMAEPELRRRIAPIVPDLVRWSYQRIAEICREHRVPVVGIVFPEPRRSEESLATTVGWASEAGIPLLDLQGFQDGHAMSALRLTSGDMHLNALGHQLVANRLYQLLHENDARALKLGFQK